MLYLSLSPLSVKLSNVYCGQHRHKPETSQLGTVKDRISRENDEKIFRELFLYRDLQPCVEILPQFSVVFHGRGGGNVITKRSGRYLSSIRYYW